MTFTPQERAFLDESDLGRLATVQRDGTPQNSPVSFTYNEALGTIDISGYRMSRSQKFRNLAHNDRVAFVVDDIVSRDPWRVRCIEIRGTAAQEGEGDGAIIRVTPKRIISFGVGVPDVDPHELEIDIRDV